MSRLVAPGPGEILDRLTILSLKIVHGRQAGTPVGHWAEEREVLCLAHCTHAWCPSACLLELAAVNAALWQAEDQIREMRQRYTNATGAVSANFTEGDVEEGFQCALRIATLNDRRAVLVHQINTQGGIDRPPEKL